MITKGYRANFKTLQRVFANGDAVLLECTDKQTRQPVMVVCAVVFDEASEEFVFTPFAKLFDGNPYEEVDPPTEEAAS
ncbi:MAG: hypothetical protein EOM21_07690 [Gammaproteobacteria bacterium]|nr:hypothetical protein [Gammaproteobacteria bacterium]